VRQVLSNRRNAMLHQRMISVVFVVALTLWTAAIA